MKLPLRRKSVLVVAVIGVVLAALVAILLAQQLTDASDSQEQEQEQEQGPPVFEHLQEFQALADEHGDRAAGNPGYEAAAEYVEEQLESAGFDSSRQYFTVERRRGDIETFNIIAETDGGSDDTVIMLGAHLDGVRDSPAINDNASGSAALLEAAKALGQQGEPVNKVRFVWWGAEEYPNSPGSKYYVQDLAENDPGALDAIAAYLNFDMVASPNYVIGVYDARDPNNRSRLEVPEGSIQVMEFFTGYFESRDQPWVGTNWNFNSDQVNFIEEDVAVGGLFTGADERKTPRQAGLFGGTPGLPRDPNYHTSDDDIDNVDVEALTIMSDAITFAAVTLAEDSSALE